MIPFNASGKELLVDKSNLHDLGGARQRPMGSSAPPASAVITSGEREAMIAQAAYYHAERRGFEPGHAMEDWLTAEHEIQRLLLTLRR